MKSKRIHRSDEEKTLRRSPKPNAANQTGTAAVQKASTPIIASHGNDGRQQGITRTYDQAGLIELQRRYGNAFVQRYLADQASMTKDPAIVQRAPGDKAETSGGKEEEGFDLGTWLHGEIYDALKKELGEEKLKEHAKTLASKASDLLMSQVKDAQSDADFLQKAQAEMIGKMMSEDIRKGAEDLLKSPAGQKVRQFILDKAKKDPVLAVGMVLAALGAAIAANAEIPQLKKDVDLGAGVKASGSATLGKFQELAIKQVNLGLSYSSKYFQSSITGGYSGEGEKKGFSGEAKMTAGVEQSKFTTSAALQPDGTMQVNLTPAFKLKYLEASGTVGYSAKGWNGLGQLKLGDKNTYLSTQLKVDEAGNVSINLGQQFKYDVLTFSSSLAYGEKGTSMGNKINLDNIFGANGFNVNASLNYTLGEDAAVTAAGLGGGYKLVESAKGPVPYLWITLDGKYQKGKEGAPNAAVGTLMLVGEF